MQQDLKELIEIARNHEITEEEHRAQVRSFAYGNCSLENPAITREMIDQIADAIEVQKAD